MKWEKDEEKEYEGRVQQVYEEEKVTEEEYENKKRNRERARR
jgi:hypothetical protein